MASQPDKGLELNDLRVLQKSLWDVRSQWYNIGLELGLNPNTLDTIKQSNHYAVEDCFRDMLVEWLRQDRVPTLGSLYRALKSPMFGYDFIADRVAAELGPQDAAHSTQGSETSRSPSSSRLDERPTLSKLSALKTPAGSIVRIIKALAPNWKIVGDLLEFDDVGEKLKVIDEDNRGNPETCCRDMFQVWLLGEGKQPSSWRTLLEILRDGDMKALASEIEAALL